MSPNAKRREDLTGSSAAEEASINAANRADKDARELPAKDLATLMPFPEPTKRRGRPKATKHKIRVTLRLDPEVVEHFRRGGRGWQTRINAALASYMQKQRREGD